MYADLVWQSETDGSESAHLWGAAAGPSGKALLFTWKDVSEIKVADFKHAILRYAKRCKEHKLTFAFIDIRMLSAKIDFDFS